MTIDREGTGHRERAEHREAACGAETIALAALAWLLSEEDRTARLLALTGLDAGQLRSGLEDPTILAAVLDFLASYEPDLIAAAGALGIAPEALVAARKGLAA